jgi:hypothetical protein
VYGFISESHVAQAEDEVFEINYRVNIRSKDKDSEEWEYMEAYEEKSAVNCR